MQTSNLLQGHCAKSLWIGGELGAQRGDGRLEALPGSEKLLLGSVERQSHAIRDIRPTRRRAATGLNATAELGRWSNGAQAAEARRGANRAGWPARWSAPHDAFSAPPEIRRCLTGPRLETLPGEQW